MTPPRRDLRPWTSPSDLRDDGRAMWHDVERQLRLRARPAPRWWSRWRWGIAPWLWAATAVAAATAGGAVWWHQRPPRSAASVPVAAPRARVAAAPGLADPVHEEPAHEPPIEPSHARSHPARVGRTAARVDEAERAFALAERARIAGDNREAVARFDAVTSRFPHHPLAALAAFEVGRLRLDRLNDPRGALAAFAVAARLAPNSTVIVELEARRVDAWDLAGEREDCERARRRFLARYASSPYARSVEARCR